jgi:hypothetical protein
LSEATPPEALASEPLASAPNPDTLPPRALTLEAEAEAEAEAGAGAEAEAQAEAEAEAHAESALPPMPAEVTVFEDLADGCRAT